MTYLGFVLANLGRNTLRTALTGGAIMLAVMLVCLLLTDGDHARAAERADEMRLTPMLRRA